MSQSALNWDARSMDVVQQHSADRPPSPHRARVRRKKWRKKKTARSGGRLRIASKYSVTQQADELGAGSAELSPPVPSINVDVSQSAAPR